MKKSGAIKTAIYEALSSTLPGVLASAGLADFDDYVSGTPYDADRKQCAVYIAPTTYEETYLEREIIVQMTLPGEFGPEEYQDATEDTVFGLASDSIAGALTKRYDLTTWYANELKDGQSAFLLYSLKYTEELDVCDLY